MIVGSSQRISRKCPHDHGLASRAIGLADGAASGSRSSVVSIVRRRAGSIGTTCQ